MQLNITKKTKKKNNIPFFNINEENKNCGICGSYFSDTKIKNLFNSKTITIIGCGGIGSYMAEFIARSNINLILIDKDKVDSTNLERQNYNIKDLNKNKTDCLKKKIKKINKLILIENYNIDVTKYENLQNILEESDFIVVATDNMESKKKINEISYFLKIPTIFLSAYSNIGEIFFTNYSKDSSCFNCFYNKKNDSHIKLKEVGVIPTIPTIVSLNALNIIYEIFKNKKNEEKFINTIFRFDFANINITKIKFNKNSNCEVCNNGI